MLRPHTFTNLDDGAHWPDSLAPHRWLALLDPGYLQVLEITLTPGRCSFFRNPSLHPFPSLRSIRCYGGQEMLQLLPMLLSNFPALRFLELCLVTEAQDLRIVEALESPHTSSVPPLEQYIGPHEFLPFVLGRAMESPSAHLRHLVLRSVAKTSNSLVAFVNTLKSCHPLQLRGLTHLHISSLQSMDLKSLTTFQDMFPVLQKLRIHAPIHPLAGLSYWLHKQTPHLT
jgi:hypothetical protein